MRWNAPAASTRSPPERERAARRPPFRRMPSRLLVREAERHREVVRLADVRIAPRVRGAGRAGADRVVAAAEEARAAGGDVRRELVAEVADSRLDPHRV